jgi:hypothetical protein
MKTTARPLSGKLGIPIHLDQRLKERVLDASHMEEWKKLSNPDVYQLKIEDGEVNERIWHT